MFYYVIYHSYTYKYDSSLDLLLYSFSPVGIFVIAWMRPYSSYRRVEFTGMLAMELHLVSGTLAKELSRVYSFWHAGQGVLSW